MIIKWDITNDYQIGHTQKEEQKHHPDDETFSQTSISFRKALKDNKYEAYKHVTRACLSVQETDI